MYSINQQLIHIQLESHNQQKNNKTASGQKHLHQKMVQNAKLQMSNQSSKQHSNERIVPSNRGNSAKNRKQQQPNLNLNDLN